MTDDLSKLKSIPGYPGYLASEDGKIYTTKRSTYLVQKIRGNTSYYSVMITNNGKTTTVPVHKLVALAWVPIPAEYLANVNEITSIIYSFYNRELVVDHINRRQIK